MHVLISAQHVDLSSELQDYAKAKIAAIVSKYFEKATSTSVHFSKDARHILCNIVVHDGVGGHVVIKSDATSDDPHLSFDLAVAKSEKRLRKYRDRLHDRYHGAKSNKIDKILATKYTISSEEENTEDAEFPVIVAEREVEVPRATVSEAVMRMELENLPALMFQNSKTDRMNVVYFRKDGNIAWVDSNS